MPLLLALLLLALPVVPARAHASLIRSQPPANAALDVVPGEIRLWFTEPLEPAFSQLTLHAAEGAELPTPPAQVDPVDAAQLVLLPGELPQGVYTVVWRVVSAVDGHPAQGRFVFAVGVAPPATSVLAVELPLPVDSTLLRAFDLLALALLLGVPGFWLLVWQPAGIPMQGAGLPRLMGFGWALSGLSSVLLLGLQSAQAGGVGVLAAFADAELLAQVLTDTTFGTLWRTRMAAWLLAGALLWMFSRWRDTHLLWGMLAESTALPLINSLFSHAAALPDSLTAILADWLHLLAAALWVGGLVAFAWVLWRLHNSSSPTSAQSSDTRAQHAGLLTALFSNYARTCVAALAVTGVYAAWLHVGSLAALVSTQYGQVLLLKLLLFVPLLALAGVNLLLTVRGLRTGRGVWVGRLRGLVGAEIALTCAILLAAGAMTSAEPARGAYAAQQAQVIPPAAVPVLDFQVVDGTHVHLDISPGWVGENRFQIALFEDATGLRVTDATQVRLHFDHPAYSPAHSPARSELFLPHAGGGFYEINAANLSTAGAWFLRVTVQRPGHPDLLAGFAFSIELPPPPVVVQPSALPALNDTALVLLLTGLIALVSGGYFAAASTPGIRGQFQQRLARLTALPLLLLGILFLLTAARLGMQP